MFRPEFLNRVDEIIVFHSLTDDDIGQIVDLMIGRLREQLVIQGIGITLTEGARRKLAKAGFDPAMGARPLRRAIQRFVEDPLSEQILAGQWQTGDVVELIAEGDEDLSFRKGEGTFVPPAPSEEETVPGTATASMPPRSRGSRGPAAGGAARRSRRVGEAAHLLAVLRLRVRRATMARPLP